MQVGGSRFRWGRSRQWLFKLASLSSIPRRLGIYRAVSHVVSRRHSHIKLGVRDVMRICHSEPPTADPVFIITEPRTGGTLLGDYLNCHRMVSCEYEILNQGLIPWLMLLRSEKEVRSYLNALFTALPGKIRCGKIHFDHLDQFGINVLHLLGWFPRARFVILYRRSLLDQFVSLKLAETTGRWMAIRPEEETDQMIHIDVNELLAFAEITKKRYRQVLSHDALRGRHLTISYEELVSRTDRVFETRIWPFLDIPACPVKSVLRKQNRRSGRKSTSNLQELRPLLDRGILKYEPESFL